jgi:hypothetical protein
MGFFSSKRPSDIIYAVALAGLVMTAGATRTIGFDVWWHLTTGWVIANMHLVPMTDMYSYTAFGAPWVNHEWLFELLQWLIYAAGGVTALTALKLVTAGSMTWLLFKTIESTTLSRTAALWGSAIFLWGSTYRMLDRPFLLGMLFLAFVSYALHRQAARGTRLIWVIPVVQVIWINMHGGGLLGVELTLAFALGETLQGLAHRTLGADAPLPSKRRTALWTVALLSILASMLNPWGTDIFLFFGEHARMTTILAQTQEWLPLLHPYLDGLIPPAIYTTMLFGTLLSFIVGARHARISHLLVTILSAAILYMGHRFGPEFMIVNLPIMLFNFRPLAQSMRSGKHHGFVRAWINLTIVFAISVASVTWGLPIHRNGTLLNEMGVGTEKKYAPATMVDFLEFYDIGGRVFNEMGLGSYLIFRRWPRERVFIDGRTPVYGDEFYKIFVNALRNSRNFEELDARYHFDYLVFSSFKAWEKRAFHAYLWQRPEWALVYARNDGFVYLRRNSRNKALIEKLGLKTHPIVDQMKKEAARTQATPTGEKRNHRPKRERIKGIMR